MERTSILEPSCTCSRVRAPDADAFAGLVGQFQSAIVNYLYRLTGDKELARDLAQDTFLQAYEGLATTVLTVSFKSWLYRIATNNALQCLRRQARISFVPLDDGRSPRLGMDLDQNTEAAAVHEALLKVTEKRRVCMVLHFVDGFKHREIARMLGISEDAVRMRVARGCAEFRQLYRASGRNLP